MRSDWLAHLSLLSGSIAHPLRVRLLVIIETLYPQKTKKNAHQLVNIYSAFIFSQGYQNFDAISVLSDKDKLQLHIEQLIGFLYEESQNITITTKGMYAKCLHEMMCKLGHDYNIDIAVQGFSNKKTNNYVQHCLKLYKKLTVDDEKLTYLNGWELTSQEREQVNVGLNFIYVKYGRSFTDKIHNALKHYGLTQKTITLRSRISQFSTFLEVVTFLDKKNSVQSLEDLLSAINVASTFLKVYYCMLSTCIARNHNIVKFNNVFNDAIHTYQVVFVKTKIYPAPLLPFVTPSLKKVYNPPSFSIGGKTDENEKMRWFADIPLHIKDEEAVAIIEARINRDMNYLKSTFINHFNDLKARHERNKTFIESGWVKPLVGNTGGVPGTTRLKIGLSYLENTIATFYHYGVNGYKGHSYSRFLGYRGYAAKLEKELNLPNNSTLFSLTALLVMEHPKITPAWLQKLQLFYENGKLSGYKQVGELYILTSEKERRGRALAQQDVILNDFSKSIVDFLVEHTEPARQHLKSTGNSDWKYLLLTCTTNKATKSIASDVLFKPKEITIDLLTNQDYSPAEHDLSQGELDTIANITTHRSIRRHRALQIFLKTRSQSAVADALGHKEADNQLLFSYLPKPLMEFFTERVIRQFQQAITFKAMEESPYLLDAMNVNYDELKEFFENHGLNKVPEFNTKTFDGVTFNRDESYFDNVVFTITVPLIQVLISIKTIVDSDKGESSFNDLVQHWYQSACYVLNRFSLGDFSGNDEIKEMYEIAKDEPLNLDIIKEAISC
ncbi:hypothetical protein ACNO5M_15250 [Vibrio owensii]|uniref:hypothetical protein n=1 Tax=Vibrio owensii TaxID=696485 RepID=UPI003AB0C979